MSNYEEHAAGAIDRCNIRSARDDRPGERARRVFAGCRGFRCGGRRQLGTGRGPALDEDAETADKVLEIPQVACAKDGVSVPCDGGSDEDADDDGQAINAPSPGAPPTLDDDTADARLAQSGLGHARRLPERASLRDSIRGMSPYGMTVAVGTMNRSLSPVPASAYVPMSSPLTQAARPPLNPGPWMTPPSMSAFSHPAGSPMMGMTMSHPSFGFHRLTAPRQPFRLR